MQARRADALSRGGAVDYGSRERRSCGLLRLITDAAQLAQAAVLQISPGWGRGWRPIVARLSSSLTRHLRGHRVPLATSVPIPKFASLCCMLVCELRNRKTLATY